MCGREGSYRRRGRDKIRENQQKSIRGDLPRLGFPPPKFGEERVTQAMMSLVGSTCQRGKREVVY
jgi:hypothetical protein